MQSKNYLKNLAKKYNKLTRPGKFGVFILICIFILFSFESLGLSLSNIQSYLQIRTFNKKNSHLVKPQEKKAQSSYKSSSTMDAKLRVAANQFQNNERKIIEMEKILLQGALYQQSYENNLFIEKIEMIKNLDKKIEEIKKDAEMLKRKQKA